MRLGQILQLQVTDAWWGLEFGAVGDWNVAMDRGRGVTVVTTRSGVFSPENWRMIGENWRKLANDLDGEGLRC